MMLGVVENNFDPSTQEAEEGEFQNLRPAWYTQKNPIWKKKTKQETNKQTPKHDNVPIKLLFINTEIWI